MSIKILGGMAKGLTLITPQIDSLRPTSILLRRRVFDSHQDLSSSIFIDCCAGSGSMGLEALSRSADEIIFVESHSMTFSCLLKNIQKVEQVFKKISQRKKIMAHRMTVEKWLKKFLLEFQSWPEEKKARTIFFIDPPYKNRKTYQFIVEELKEIDQFPGQLWIESSKLEGPSEQDFIQWGLQCKKIFTQGANFIAICQF